MVYLQTELEGGRIDADTSTRRGNNGAKSQHQNFDTVKVSDHDSRQIRSVCVRLVISKHRFVVGLSRKIIILRYNGSKRIRPPRKGSFLPITFTTMYVYLELLLLWYCTLLIISFKLSHVIRTYSGAD